MHIFTSGWDLPESEKGAVLAIGNFDGLHPGHQAIIRTVIEEARRTTKPAGVLTFQPHPRAYFRPADPPFMLTTTEDKIMLLQETTLDFMVAMPFTDLLSKMRGEDFVREVLIKQLKARHIVVGEGFMFGHERSGDTRTLEALSEKYDYRFTRVSGIKDENGAVYSSSRIRQALREGDVVLATRLLGRPWHIRARVERGDQRGRQIGVPTANLSMGDHLRPLRGVYAVRVTTPDNTLHHGVANYGIRPTVDGTKEWLEVHLFDFNQDLYGQSLKVEFLGFIRPEQKFDGIEALKAQIARDIETAKSLVG